MEVYYFLNFERVFWSFSRLLPAHKKPDQMHSILRNENSTVLLLLSFIPPSFPPLFSPSSSFFPPSLFPLCSLTMLEWLSVLPFRLLFHSNCSLIGSLLSSCFLFGSLLQLLIHLHSHLQLHHLFSSFTSSSTWSSSCIHLLIGAMPTNQDPQNAA